MPTRRRKLHTNTKDRMVQGVQVTRDFIERMKRVAHDLDIENDGMFDCRSGCINFWCREGDKPKAWTDKILGGQSECDYVGGVYFEWKDDNIAALKLDVTPYKLENDDDAALDSCLDWCEEKLRYLMRLADLQPSILGTCCPFCDYYLPNGELLNTLVSHVIAAHPEVKVEGVVLADPPRLVTDKGEVPLNDKEESSG